MQTTVLVVFTLTFHAFFDRIQHNVLLNVLEKRFGIKGRLLAWIRDWLSNHKQRVVLKGTFLAQYSRGPSLGVILAQLMLDKVDDELMYAKIFKYADDNKAASTVQRFCSSTTSSATRYKQDRKLGSITRIRPKC